MQKVAALRRAKGRTRRRKQGRKRQSKRLRRIFSLRLKRYIGRGGGSTGPTGPTIDLVIARYKEPLDWLTEFKDYPFRKIIVYNKSDKPIGCVLEGPQCEIVKLPNVGTCDHTYLTHFYTRYDDLADVTVCAPGSANMSHKLPRLKNTIKKAFETYNTVIYGRKHERPIKETLKDFVLDKWVTSAKENQEPGETYEHAPAAIRPFGSWYSAHFPGLESKFEGSVGIFAVSRTDAHHSSKEKYAELLKEVNKVPYHEAAHYMERSWPSIFHPIVEDSFIGL